MNTAVTQAIRFGTYPLVFGGSTALLLALVAGGVPYAVVGPLLLVAVGLVVAVAERAQPFARAWQQDGSDVRADWAHTIANLVLSHLSLALYAAAAPIRAHLPRLWSDSAPWLMQVLAAFVLVDVGLYLVHRASHVLPWLWRLHAIHHSSERVYWLNANRRHLLHEILEGAPGLLVLAILGAPPIVVACAVAIVSLHLFFQHANVDYRLGWLTRVFAVAETHRWHHQRRYEDVQGNYGAVLALWDQIFGTTLHTSGDAPLDVGIDDATMPRTWWGQMLWPLRATGRALDGRR